MGQTVSSVGASNHSYDDEKARTAITYIPYDIVWKIIGFLDGEGLRTVSVLNKSIQDAVNVRLWRSFTIDYDFDYKETSKRRADIRRRCWALTRDPIRAKHIKSLVLQFDAPLGSAFGFSAKKTIRLMCRALISATELESLQVHCTCHQTLLAKELSNHAHLYTFRLKRLTMNLQPEQGIEKFLGSQPTITHYEINRGSRLETGSNVVRRTDYKSLSSDLLPALLVVYVHSSRANSVIACRSLHTVEITNVLNTRASTSPTDPPMTASVEHLSVNLHTREEWPLRNSIVSWGIDLTSIRYLHIAAAFPTFASAFSVILAGFTSLEGLQWSAKRKSKTFPSPLSMIVPNTEYCQDAVKACSECCKTLQVISFQDYFGKAESWRVSPLVGAASGRAVETRPGRRTGEREVGTSGSHSGSSRGRLTVSDRFGKRWLLSTSVGSVWRRRAASFPPLLPIIPPFPPPPPLIHIHPDPLPTPTPMPASANEDSAPPPIVIMLASPAPPEEHRITHRSSTPTISTATTPSLFSPTPTTVAEEDGQTPIAGPSSSVEPLALMRRDRAVEFDRQLALALALDSEQAVFEAFSMLPHDVEVASPSSPLPPLSPQSTASTLSYASTASPISPSRESTTSTTMSMSTVISGSSSPTITASTSATSPMSHFTHTTLLPDAVLTSSDETSSDIIEVEGKPASLTIVTEAKESRDEGPHDEATPQPSASSPTPDSATSTTSELSIRSWMTSSSYTFRL